MKFEAKFTNPVEQETVRTRTCGVNSFSSSGRAMGFAENSEAKLNPGRESVREVRTEVGEAKGNGLSGNSHGGIK